MSEEFSRKIKPEELQIVDSEGKARIRLSALHGTPSVKLLNPDGTGAASLKLEGDGRPSLSLNNLSSDGPTAILEIDDKGAHIKFDCEGGASSYLFLNNAGGSGVVFYDAQGERRLSLVVGADGKIAISPYPLNAR
ncbi:hypothetical protein [Agrobacterium tumefaciens]|uniref:hypothetical protein n=1 Tax=Agrobacterium tumefaciens TaxID=358 RepID=UPI0015749D47|nr:hypothetical protein [Agrobacterium tumefaciens]WCK69501.1 hypothetical protein G6L23_026855 [Agrobacterium tumefaciens]